MNTRISEALEGEGRIQSHQRQTPILVSLGMRVLQERITTAVLSLWARIPMGYWWSLVGSFFIVLGISVIFYLIT